MPRILFKGANVLIEKPVPPHLCRSKPTLRNYDVPQPTVDLLSFGHEEVSSDVEIGRRNNGGPNMLCHRDSPKLTVFAFNFNTEGSNVVAGVAVWILTLVCCAEGPLRTEPHAHII